jgi:WD40 repeat protein
VHPELPAALPPLSSSWSNPEHLRDWGDAPDVDKFVGRVAEQAELRRWVVMDRCRVVALLGLGGIGKSTLAAALARDLANDFQILYWRSLRNAPPVDEWLANAIEFLSNHELLPSEGEMARRGQLLDLLRQRRCLLVLDNLETVLPSDDESSGSGYGNTGFVGLVQALAQSPHQSCLLLTSREVPIELDQLRAQTGPVRALALDGMSVPEGQALLEGHGIWGDQAAWTSLVHTYAGNGLALKVASATIQQVFGGDIAAFISYVKETYGLAVRGIRRLMDTQVERRLSSLEMNVLRWLAIEREPVTLAKLRVDLEPGARPGAIMEAVESLRRRSLVEFNDHARGFTLQSVVLEYVTDRLVEQVADELVRGQPGVLATHPVVKAQSKDHVRQSQERLIAEPLLERLTAEFGTGADKKLLAFFDYWRDRPHSEQGYGPGTTINLLRLLRGDLRNLDLSHLFIRQAFMQGVEAQDTSLAYAKLSEAVLADAFEPILSVSLSADGQIAVAGTMGGEVRVWRVDERTPLVSMRGHTGSVYGVAVSTDGQLVVSGAVDGRICFWDGTKGDNVQTFQAHAGGVYGVALSPDRRLVASSGVDGVIRLWSAGNGAAIGRLLGHRGVVYDVSLDSDGGLLASAGADGTVRLWATRSGACLSVLSGHVGPVRSVAISADGRLLASGGLDGTVRLWDVAADECAATLAGHVSSVWSVSLSSDGGFLASSGVDGTVRIWDVARRTSVATLHGHAGAVWSVALNDDGALAASGGVDGTVRIWETGSRVCTTTVQGQTGLLRGVSMRADGHQVVSSGVDGTIRLWDVASGACVITLRETPGTVYQISLTADGSLLASGELDGRVHLRDLNTGRHVATVHAHSGAAYGVALSGDGALMASSSIDGAVCLWHVHSWTRIAKLEGHNGAVWGVALSTDGQLLASGGQDGVVRIWNPASGECLRVLHVNTGTIYCVALSGDGRLLASGGLDGVIRLWNPTNGQMLWTLQAGSGVVRGVGLSGDGRLLVAGGQDGAVRLWDTRSRTSICSFRPDRPYQRLDITGLTGVTDAQREALLALGAVQGDGVERA